MKFLQSFVHLFWNTSIFSALSSQLWHSHLNRFHHSSLLLKPFYWTWFSWWKMIKTGTMRQEKIKLGKVWAQTQKVEESSKHLVSSGVQIYKMFVWLECVECGWNPLSVEQILIRIWTHIGPTTNKQGPGINTVINTARWMVLKIERKFVLRTKFVGVGVEFIFILECPAMRWKNQN